MIGLHELLLGLEIGFIYGIIAVGIYITFRVIDFPDLTCDGTFVFGAAVSSVLIKNGYSPFLALVGALGAGSVAGCATGILYTRFKVTDLLAGILVAFMLYSVNLRVMQGVPNIALLQHSTIFTGTNALIVLMIISGILWLMVGYLLNTDFGLALRSIGRNKRLAQQGGIHVKRMTVIGLILSNSLIALGGALFSQHQGFADIGSGAGTVIIGLASVMIGERLFAYRSLWVSVLSCFLGSLMYRMFISIALHSDLLGLQTYDLNMITGIMIIGVMLLPRRLS